MIAFHPQFTTCSSTSTARKDSRLINSIPSAVYVHLGSDIPIHLKYGLVRHKSLFPDQRVILIADEFVKVEKFVDIEIFSIDSANLQKNLFDSMSKHLDFNFRGGFWKYTLQRFFAISKFHETCPQSNLVHIESDVLVMPEFPWKQFSSLKTLAWLKVNDNIDVAAIVFLPNSGDSKLLSSEIMRFALENPLINDMEALHQFAKENPLSQVYLPSVTPDTLRRPETLKTRELNMLEHFEGVFDPLILGLWNFGQDPKNTFGIRRRYVDDVSHHLHPEKAHLKYSNGILLDQHDVRVYSLHLHSKYLPLFGPNWERTLINGLRQSMKKSNQFSFHPTALVAAIKGRKLKENIWILVALIPGVGFLRKSQLVENKKNVIKRWLHI